MFRKILVPLDRSAFSEFALPVALKLARLWGAELRLLTVATPATPAFADQGMEVGPEQGGDLPNSETPFPIDDVAEREVGEYLAALAEELQQVDGAGKAGQAADGSPVTISHAVRHGVPVEAIHREAQETGADLVVMTTHARGPVSRVWLGSVADELVRESAVPVLLIRPESDGEPDFVNAGDFRHILVPLAEWEGSREVLADVGPLAESLGARVTLLHVESMPRTLTSPYIPHAAEEQRKWTDREREVEAEVDRLGEGLRARGVDVTSKVIAASDPSDGILDFAEASAVDVIAMATRGRRGFDRLLRGSVSDEVTRSIDAAVFLRRVPGKPE